MRLERDPFEEHPILTGIGMFLLAVLLNVPGCILFLR